MASSPALAGGPLANCRSGVPFVWGGGGTNIPFNPDLGDLAGLDHAAALTAVAAAFDQWTNIPTSTVSYKKGPELPVDVNITNFEPWLDAAVPDGLSAIVFDDTGEIFDLLFGPFSGVLGFAGPEWGDTDACSITEGMAFLNGPAFGDLTVAVEVMVHEFGHYTNLAHSVVNGQMNFMFPGFDHSGPSPHNTFGDRVSITQIEVMYPFYFGAGTGSLKRDDIVTVSTLYPEPTFFASTAAISGTIFAANGTSRLSGVNVIARNIGDPFDDAVSAISGDRTDDTSQSDPLTGTYRFNGLTPGAHYAVFVDQIWAGGFSTPPLFPLPGPEEFHNAGESNDVTASDDPGVFTAVTVPVGGLAAGVDVIFNTFAPGEPLPVGDIGFVELSLPFVFKMCGQEFTSVFANAYGRLTFGPLEFNTLESIHMLLTGFGAGSVSPPSINALWTDLNPAAGGTVSYDQTADTFRVTWDSVPEFPDLLPDGTPGRPKGSNSFTISLDRAANQARIEYGDLSSTQGLAGLACGSEVTSGYENERDLIRSGGHGHQRTIDMAGETAAFEIFTASDNDLSGATLTFVNFKKGFDDVFESSHRNDTISRATAIELPFNTASTRKLTEISPVGNDVDYYSFRARSGDILAIEVVRGSPDTLLGLFDAATGVLLAVNDDDGPGLLSRILFQVPAVTPSIRLAVAVTSWPDFDFDGQEGVSGGRYTLVVNKYRGQILSLGDDTSIELPLSRPFRFQGTNWNSVFVNSNGNLTFGAGDTNYDESVAALLEGPPRIAALWNDLYTPGGLVIAEQDAYTTTIHYVSVPWILVGLFLIDSSNYFSVKLLPFDIIKLEYGAVDRLIFAIVGVTDGGGTADPGETDLSRGLNVFSSNGTTYEQFPEFPVEWPPKEIDFPFQILFFVPLF
jgi:hypothetical protein